jgi:hypothetical protein
LLFFENFLSSPLGNFNYKNPLPPPIGFPDPSIGGCVAILNGMAQYHIHRKKAIQYHCYMAWDGFLLKTYFSYWPVKTFPYFVPFLLIKAIIVKF